MFQNNSVRNSLFIVECIDVNRGSILDNYASHDVSLSSCNLYQFITNYTTIRGQVRKRSAPVVVRTFPNYSANPHCEKYAQFCRIQLLKYQPWSNTIRHSWQSESSDETFITSYQHFLETQAAKDHVPHFAEELDRAQHYLQQEEDMECEETEPTHQQDYWMQLCSLNNQYAMQASLHSSINWSEYAQSLPPHKIREASSWITSTRKDTSHSIFTRHLPLQH